MPTFEHDQICTVFSSMFCTVWTTAGSDAPLFMKFPAAFVAELPIYAGDVVPDGLGSDMEF